MTVTSSEMLGKCNEDSDEQPLTRYVNTTFNELNTLSSGLHTSISVNTSHVKKRNIVTLGVVGSYLEIVKFFKQHLWVLHDVVVVWPGSCNNVAPGHTH